MYYFIFNSWSGENRVHLLRQPQMILLHQAPMMNEMEHSVIGQTEVLGQNPPTYLFVHHMTWDWTWSVAVGSRRLTAWPMPHPPGIFLFFPEPTVRGSSFVLLFCIPYTLSLSSYNAWRDNGNAIGVNLGTIKTGFLILTGFRVLGTIKFLSHI